MNMKKPSPEQHLVEDVIRFSRDPLGYAKYAYPWEKLGSHLRPWQEGILGLITEHLQSAERFTPLCIAVSSGHGVGKSALVGMLSNWAVTTCEDARGIITANTLDQLRTKTWPEVNKWSRMAVNAHWMGLEAQKLYVKSKGHEATWRIDIIPWSENNTEAFQGFHNIGKRILLIFDEASAIHDKVWEASEGFLTDQDTEIIWLAFGNPTQNTGRFRECFGRYKHRWKIYHVDSRT